MNKFWQTYSDKFQVITLREQMLILLTGAVAIVFILHSLFIDENTIRSNTFIKDNKKIAVQLKSKQQTIAIFEQALSEDPNQQVNEQILQYENQLGQIDSALLALTSDLIDPIQMRFALIDLLKLQKGVSLKAFEVIPAQVVALNSTQAPLNETEPVARTIENEQVLTLYKHGIKLTLSGSYLQLRDYMSQLEQLQWTFFWHKFDYNLTQYPTGKLEVELYSLSTKREFIGV
ncbi:MAG: hypothetical protein ACPG46_00915 [Thalassotalea sp.]